MKKLILLFCLMFITTMAYSQVGHVMQGVGSVNMSMGGAATAQPLDITGALQWNPASISAFDNRIIKLDVGLFFSSPELNSTVPVMDNTGQPTGDFVNGTTKDDKGISPMPALSIVWGAPDSKHTFGASAFGISGFGVTFPENLSNPINMPQQMGGFGRVQSNYALFQVGLTYAYELTKHFSIGVEPTFNYAMLELTPNPLANPTQAGYPSTNNASAVGLGGQVGLFYDSGMGFKAGLSYKSTQHFNDFEFENTYLDNTTSTNSFNMDFPAIYSVGLGYSLEMLDVAVDYRYVDYENTDGFSEAGWKQTGSVKGFGWENISVISAGVQYKGIDRLPLRIGYTFSSNPITEEVTFFNAPATAIIKNAYQIGFSFEATEAFQFNLMYHHGQSDGATSGMLLNPNFVSQGNPMGAIPGSNVSYEMTTDLLMGGVRYQFR